MPDTVVITTNIRDANNIVGLVWIGNTMLDLKPSCECCDKDLPAASSNAMICTYECTFCKDCVDKKLNAICPNCGGNFAPRPIRPASMLLKHPPSTKRVHNPQSCA